MYIVNKMFIPLQFNVYYHLMCPLNHQQMMRDINNHPTEVVSNHGTMLINGVSYFLSLASDTDVSSGKPSTEQEKHKQSLNTAGK